MDANDEDDRIIINIYTLKKNIKTCSSNCYENDDNFKNTIVFTPISKFRDITDNLNNYYTVSYKDLKKYIKECKSTSNKETSCKSKYDEFMTNEKLINILKLNPLQNYINAENAKINNPNNDDTTQNLNEKINSSDKNPINDEQNNFDEDIKKSNTLNNENYVDTHTVDDVNFPDLKKENERLKKNNKEMNIRHKEKINDLETSLKNKTSELNRSKQTLNEYVERIEFLTEKNEELNKTIIHCTAIARQILDALNQQGGGVNPHLTDFLKHFLK